MLDIGIFRKIPITNNITRTDGTKSSNKAQITNISVSESYTTYIENRSEDIVKAAADREYQEQLLKEFNLL